MPDFLESAREIRRSDLYASRSQSPVEHDESVSLSLQARLEAIFGSQTYATITAPSDPAPQDETELTTENETTGYAFRLFATPPASPKAITNSLDACPQSATTFSNLPRVILADDELTGSGAFLNPVRPLSYFLSTPPSPTRQSQYKASAIDAASLYNNLSKPYLALNQPWKVNVIKVRRSKSDVIVTPHAVQLPLSPTNVEASLAKRATKPNKAARIKLRVKKRLEEEVKVKKQVELVRKAESEKEKKIRRNREKKLKRREKEKAEKAEKAAARAGDVVEDQADSTLDTQVEDMAMS